MYSPSINTIIPSRPLLTLTPAPTLRLPHFFQFNGCWSSFRLLLFAFRRFHSFHRSPRSWLPRTGHSTISSRPSFPMCIPPTRPLVSSCSSGRHSPSSIRNLFLVPLSSFLFCATLLSCFSFAWFPPTRGSWSFVSKGVEGKSRRRYIRTNILYPHPLPQPPLYPTHLRLLPSPSPRPPITIHQVADCLFISLFVSNCCHLSCAGPHHNLGRPYTLRDSRARNNRRKRYSKHLSFVATPTLPPPPRDDGLFILLSAALKASDTSLYQVFPLTIVTSCIFFPRSSCSIIWSPLAVSGLPARTRTPLHVKRPHLPLHGLFLFVFVCRGLGLFYLSGVRCWLCCK